MPRQWTRVTGTMAVDPRADDIGCVRQANPTTGPLAKRAVNLPRRYNTHGVTGDVIVDGGLDFPAGNAVAGADNHAGPPAISHIL